ncbi:hypothetical protein BZA77DRAFT_317423 [Pyronema omphalodes]|nr:hypothetical protein BZA77DRAFT_317423 [Pyronema omphalodes]
MLFFLCFFVYVGFGFEFDFGFGCLGCRAGYLRFLLGGYICLLAWFVTGLWNARKTMGCFLEYEIFLLLV